MNRYLQLAFFSLFFTSANLLFSQIEKFGFSKVLQETPHKIAPFAVSNEGERTFSALRQFHLTPSRITKEWVYFHTTAEIMNQLAKSNLISDFYFENSKPQVMNDSTRMKTFVNEIHAGTGGLSSSYTGNNVIIGYIDDGIDFFHPDLLDNNGKTRVIHFWDQTLDSVGNPRIPAPYGYGLAYDSSYINAQFYPTIGGLNFHGTNDVGIGSGDGSANGTNMGMAPDSKIIFVRSDFSISNWTLSVADACEYIFNIADQMGLPCVINTSVGTYYGSHDGNDPGAIAIESLLDAQNGRIVVGSAGNSGQYQPYHAHGEVDCDTSFVWFENNPSSGYGPNKIYFDFWANLDEVSELKLAFGANDPNSNYVSRGQTSFSLLTSFGSHFFGAVKNANGDTLAGYEIFRTTTPSSNHINFEILMSVDSTNYLYSLLSTGGGSYDVWSGIELGANLIETTLPDASVFPNIIHYHAADTMQSIVSSWQCSEKVVTVGNVCNRTSYVDFNGNTQTLPANFYTGILSPNSGIGPTRLNVVKPTVVAPGDFSFTATPLSYLSNAGNWHKVDAGGWHSRQGGTSAASPVIAGIAALYLEANPNASYADFISDLTSNAFRDGATGPDVNNAYGYGKVHGLNTLLNDSISTSYLTVDACESYTLNGQTYTQSGVYTQTLSNQLGNDSIVTIYLTIQQSNNTISLIGTNELVSNSSCGDYQWYNSDNSLPVSGETTASYIPAHGGNFAMILSQGACVDTSNFINIHYAALDEFSPSKVVLSPNPTNDFFEVHGITGDFDLEIVDLNGKTRQVSTKQTNKFDISKLSSGIYIVKITSGNEIFYTKIQRL